MVPESPYGSLDPGLVTQAGIVLVQLENQVGFPVGLQDLPDVVGNERVGRALEGGDEDRIGPGGLAGDFRRLQDLRGVVPVDVLQEGSDALNILLGIGEHVLVEDPDPF